MFAFRSDDGTNRCYALGWSLKKYLLIFNSILDRVFVSALYWIERSCLLVVGFNFGGIMIVSLKTSKVYSLFYADGMVQHLAHLDPEEDPRPVYYMWIAYNSIQMFVFGAYFLS